jgi:uncharacterized protein (UPF0261 family)
MTRRQRTIVVLGAMDTRGDEVAYIRDAIVDAGHRALSCDLGVLGTPHLVGDITREQVATAGGSSLAQLQDSAQAGADRAIATEVMTRGAQALIGQLVGDGGIDGVVGLGGSSGTSSCASIMRELPIGFPKLLVTTVASLAPIGDADITLMQSPVDLIGLNRVVNRTLSQAANAIVGMACAEDRAPSDRRLVGITALGVTTPAVQAVIERLGALDVDGVVFHARTTTLNRLIETGLIDAVIDLTTYEALPLACYSDADLADQPHERVPDRDRLAAVRTKGIPWIVAPGGLDMHIVITTRGIDGIPERLRGRPASRHGPGIMLVRSSRDDMQRVATYLADQIARTKQVAVIHPTGGFSDADRPGRPLYDPDIDREFIERLAAVLPPNTAIVRVEEHINSPEFADAVVKEFQRLSTP